MSKENLQLPPAWVGNVNRHLPGLLMPAPHRHDELELNLVTAGRAAYLLGERRYDLARNTLVWLFPGQDHVLLDRSSDHQMWVVLFKPDLLRRLGLDGQQAVLLESAPPGHHCRQASEADGMRLSLLLKEIDGVRGDTARFNASLGYALFSAWAAFLDADEPVVGPDIHPAVERAARLLRDEADPQTVSRIAAEAGLSASYLSRLFHQQTGVTLVDFRNRQRIERFLRLYESRPRMSLLEAALESGFGSYAQFHRVFSQQIGCSPAAYRRRLGRSGAY